MSFQMQTYYRDKVRQFYIESALTNYSELVENIVLNIHSLFGSVFQIQYLNDENMWITLSENDNDMNDLFRCGRIVDATEFKRIKIKIVEGCSPAEHGKKRSCEDDVLDTTECDVSSSRRKRLSFEGEGLDLCAYKSPVQLDIERKKSELAYLESELVINEQLYDEVASKYLPITRLTKHGSKQCGKCHLYLNHRRNNCPNDLCVSAQMCGDIGKHEEENAELKELESKKQKIRNEIRKERQELDLKIKCAEKINCSFAKKIEKELIDSNRKRYLVATTFGVKPRQALLNEHIAILERHYRGKMPTCLASEKMIFEKIIDSAVSKTPQQKQGNNPLRELLTTNATYPVRFPSPPSATAPPPPPSYPPSYPPMPSFAPPVGPLPPAPHGHFGYPGWLPWPVPMETKESIGTPGGSQDPDVDQSN